MLIISLGVAMDAAAVSASAGITHRRLRDALGLAVTFGGFQLLMATVGWLAGASMVRRIAAWDHWLAFVLLAFIGGKMISEARQEERPAGRVLGASALLVLGIATSIDSLAVGVTLPMLGLPLALSVGIIGAVTFVLSLAAALGARSLGAAAGGKLEILGGVVLIAIGIKILLQHFGEA